MIVLVLQSFLAVSVCLSSELEVSFMYIKYSMCVSLPQLCISTMCVAVLCI